MSLVLLFVVLCTEGLEQRVTLVELLQIETIFPSHANLKMGRWCCNMLAGQVTSAACERV